MTINASRTVIAEDTATAKSDTASSSPSAATTNRIAAPVVVMTFDWKRWIPWIFGLLVVLLIVYMLTRKRSGSAVA